MRRGEANLYFQAATVPIGGGDASAVRKHDALSDRQAQTGAAGLMLTSFRNAVERLKNTVKGFRRHAIAMVGDQNSR
jgi:hypothetical protein